MTKIVSVRVSNVVKEKPIHTKKIKNSVFSKMKLTFDTRLFKRNVLKCFQMFSNVYIVYLRILIFGWFIYRANIFHMVMPCPLPITASR